MIRLVLFILVICIPVLTGISESKKGLPNNQPQLSQSELFPEFNLSEHSALHFGIVETNVNEPNPLINNLKHFSAFDQFTGIFNITGSYREEIDLLYLIRKDHIFLSVLQI